MNSERRATVAACVAAAAVVTWWNVTPVEASSSSQWPISGAIINAYAPPSTPYGAGHRGIDVAARAGDAVLAPIAGTVTFAGSVAGRGVITVTSGRIRVSIEPIASVVRRGARVAAGQHIGVVSGVSHCPETCAHVGVRRDDDYVDPFAVLGRQPLAVLRPWP